MLFDGRCPDNIDIDINMDQNNFQAINGNNTMMGGPQAMGNPMENMPMQGMMNQPIYEAPQERVIRREIVHEVPHICPINTRIINHHICKHTYTPCYTCCEENQVSQVQCGSCCNFR